MAETKKIIRHTYTTYEGPNDLFTVAEQIDQCCEEVDVDICADEGKTEIYYAADSEEWDEKLAELRVKYKNVQNIVVKTVGPNGSCGKKYTRWTENRGCCDGVPALVWNTAESVDIIAPESSGIVVIDGGRLPLNVKIRGAGFFLDPGYKIREGYVSSFTFRVYATSYACGTAKVEITDGCSSVDGTVISTTGYYKGQCATAWRYGGESYTSGTVGIWNPDPASCGRVVNSGLSEEGGWRISWYRAVWHNNTPLGQGTGYWIDEYYQYWQGNSAADTLRDYIDSFDTVRPGNFETTTPTEYGIVNICDCEFVC